MWCVRSIAKPFLLTDVGVLTISAPLVFVFPGYRFNAGLSFRRSPQGEFEGTDGVPLRESAH